MKEYIIKTTISTLGTIVMTFLAWYANVHFRDISEIFVKFLNILAAIAWILVVGMWYCTYQIYKAKK